MKKFNCNMIVFFFACIFVIYGVWGECFNNMIHSGMDVAHCIKKGDFGTAYMVMNMVETNTIKKQNYHDRLLDINSLKENILGTRVIMKEDTIVAKSDEGFLLGYFDDELDDSLAIDEWLAAIRKNQQLAEKNEANEDSIETALLEHGYIYEKSDDVYIESEGVFVVYYFV